jgi:hypothetical protein
MALEKSVKYVVIADSLSHEYAKFLKRVQALHSDYLKLHEHRRLIATELNAIDGSKTDDPEVRALRRQTRPRGKITKSSLEIRYVVDDLITEFREMVRVMRHHYVEEGRLHFVLGKTSPDEED